MKIKAIIPICAVVMLTACGNKDESFQKPAPISIASTVKPDAYKEPTGGDYIDGDTADNSASKPSGIQTTSYDASAEYVYEEDDDSIVITRYIGEKEKVTIPAKIDGKPVVKIDEHAFRGAEIKHLTIPSNVKYIETRAFSACSSLETLTISDGVEIIDDYAFADCPKLTLVTLTDRIKEVGEGVFDNCPKIQLTYKGQTYTAANVRELYNIF